MARIKIICLIDGSATVFDGQYVVEYDPARDGFDSEGNSMYCHLITTRDPALALDLPMDQALELWRKPHGIREDGRPNRPLTAFTVELA